MAGLVPVIHVFLAEDKGVLAEDKGVLAEDKGVPAAGASTTIQTS
jgi:hypothetical protein